MSKNLCLTILSVAFVVLGMAGLFFKVEYSGWVLAFGLIAALGVDQ